MTMYHEVMMQAGAIATEGMGGAKPEKNRSWVVGSCGLGKCIRLKSLCRNVVPLRRYSFKNAPVVDGRSGFPIFYAVQPKSLTQLGEASK
ncbi:hypothetical protein AB4Z34_06805 [Ensifer sp. 2YAB10]|uniref:hypothetical protein n=1 Tax=unclassified Ensifer TaxID=2633371 RepID=UPI000DE3A2EF